MRRRACCAGLALLLWAGPANAALRLATDEFGRREMLAPAQVTPDTSSIWWVLLRDKGIDSPAALEAALAGPHPSGAARDRRLRTGAMPDALDLPVPAAHVDQIRATGARVRTVSRWLNAVSVEADLHQRSVLGSLPCVAGLVPVARGRRVGPMPVETHPSARLAPLPAEARYDLSYGLSFPQASQIGAPELHALGLSGDGVRIAVLDAGFRTDHEAYTRLRDDGRIVAAWDFVFADTSVANDSLDVAGQDRHGTLVLGVIAGYAPGQLIGLAYGAQFGLAKTEDIASETPVEEDFYVAGLEWADSLGADIITSSLSYDFGYVFDGTQGISTIAANSAASRGILLCTAMGNSGPAPTTLGAPADAFGIVSVGAVDLFGTIATFSSRGPTADGRIKPEVCARGVSVFTVEPALTFAYTEASGTSLSTPLVTGAAALLVEAHRDWTPLMVREALMHTAGRADAPDNAYGWGVVDLLSAVEYAPFGALRLTLEDAVDRDDDLPWTLAVRATARGDRQPETVTLHYAYLPGTSDSVLLTTADDSVWTGTVPFVGEQGIDFHIRVVDSAGRPSRFPATERRAWELRRRPDSLYEDFELGGLRWQRGGTGGLWWVSALAAASGEFALTDSPHGPYPAGADGWFATRYPLPVTLGGTWQLAFSTRYQMVEGDTGLVEYRTAGDGAWLRLAALSGTRSEWTTLACPLTAAAGDSLALRFRLISDLVDEGDGWYIDAVRLSPRATGVADDGGARPRAFRLGLNHPNPFNPATEIEFELCRPGRVTMIVYNVAGRRVKTLLAEHRPAGIHRVRWDGTDAEGHAVASGVYFYRLETAGDRQTRKMLLIR